MYPAAPGGVSASGLQTLGSCPRRVFSRYGLRIEPPEQVVLHPTQWLDPLAFGSLLHELFEQFMRQLLEQERLPEFARDHDLLQQLLDQKVAEYADHFPPPTQVAVIVITPIPRGSPRPAKTMPVKPVALARREAREPRE